MSNPEQIIPTIKPLPKQDKAWEYLLDKVTKYLLFGGGAGGGKSWLGCEWLLVMCETYPGTRWFIGRKKLTVLMKSSFITFKKVCKHHNIPRDHWTLNGKYNYIEFFNGSRIDLLDLKLNPSDPMFEELGSIEYTGGWIEEAGEVVFKAFDVLKTRIGRHMNKEYGIHPKMLLTCNPKKNWLKRIIWKLWKKGKLKKIYAYVQSLYSDNYYTSDIYGEQLSEIADKVTKQRLKGGNWDYDDDENCLINGQAIQDIWFNPVEASIEKYAILDIARFGKDTTKLYLWKGFRVYKIITWKNQDTAVTATKVKKILIKRNIPRSHLIGDEIGIGAGVIDQIKGMNGFVANSVPLERKDREKVPVIRNGEVVWVSPKENFASLKDQCGWMLADKINNYEMSIDIDDENLKEMIEEELGELKDEKPDEDVKKQLTPKDDIKESIGRSPDDLDCLLMRMWFELSPVDAKKKRGITISGRSSSGSSSNSNTPHRSSGWGGRFK